MKRILLLFSFFIYYLSYNQVVCPSIGVQIKDNEGNESRIVSCDNQLPAGGLTLTATYPILNSTDSYTLSSATYNPIIPYTTGTIINFPDNDDDNWSGVIDMPFKFCFFGQTYNQLIVSENGVVSFDITEANQKLTYANATLPNNNLPVSAIFGAFHDLNNSSTIFGCMDTSGTLEDECGDVRYAIIGTAPCRVFVINFNNLNHYACTDKRSSFQILLYETTNKIEVNIKDKPLNCEANEQSTLYRKNALVGIQNQAGTVAYTPPGRNSGIWETTDESWEWNPNGTSVSTITWTDSEGNLLSNSNSININPIEPITYTAQVNYSLCPENNIEVTDTYVVTYDELYPKSKPTIKTYCDINTVNEEEVDLMDKYILDDAIGSQTGLTLSYHLNKTDADINQNPILNPTTYTLTAAQTILYLRAQRTPTCASVAQITLNLTQKPVPAVSSFKVCDIGNNSETITLSDYSTAILGSQNGFSVVYYNNLADADSNSNPITTVNLTQPTTTLGIRIVGNNSCFSTAEITFNLLQEPVFLDDDISVLLCINESEHDLTQHENEMIGPNTYNIQYFQNAEATEPITDPKHFILDRVSKVYVKISNTSCSKMGVINFNYTQIPQAKPDRQLKCDSDEDGIETFNLDDSRSDMITPITDYTFTYFTDYEGADINDPTKLIPDPTDYPISMEDRVVWARIVDNNTGCYTVEKINLIAVSLPFPQKESIIICDDLNDGKETVLASSLNTPVIGTQRFVETKYYATENDAILDRDEKNSFEITTATSPLSVWVKMTIVDTEENPGEKLILCSKISSFQLELKNQPPAASSLEVEICDNNNDNFETYDLTQHTAYFLNGATNLSVTYLNSAGGGIPDPTQAEIVDFPTTFIVLLSFTDNQSPCTSSTTLIIKSKEKVVINTPIDFPQCDENTDGSETFDLSSKLAKIRPDFSNYSISYYDDIFNAEKKIDPISSSVTISADKSYYVRLEKPSTGCYSVATVNARIIPKPVPLLTVFFVCDYLKDGIEKDYNLNELNSSIVGSQPVISIKYYENVTDANNNATNSITTKDIVNSANLWVRLENEANCWTVTQITLTLLNPPPAQSITAPDTCDNNADNNEVYDLTQNNAAIIPTPSNYVFLYYPNKTDALNGDNQITNPTLYNLTQDKTVFGVRVYYTGQYSNCYAVIEMTVNFKEKIKPLSAQLVECDWNNSKVSVFNLLDAIPAMIPDPTELTKLIYKFYDTKNGADNQIPADEITNYTAYTSANDNTIWVRFYNPTTGCYSINFIRLIVDEVPKSVPGFTPVCDTNFNGTPDIFLPNLNALVINNTSKYTFSYFTTYANADANLNPIPNATTASYEITESLPTSIYVRIQSIVCHRIERVSLNFQNKVPVNNPVTKELEECDGDNGDTDGYDLKTYFFLNQIESYVTSQSGATFKYYKTQEDLNKNENPLSLKYMSESNYQSIYVRVSAFGFCDNWSIFYIKVKPKPVPKLTGEDYFCPNETYVIDGGSGFAKYLWDNGETNRYRTVDNAGTYSLTIFNEYGCSASSSFVLHAYPLPETRYEFISKTSVRIYPINPDSKYHYSLNNPNNFSENSLFTNLKPGLQTVYVKSLETNCINTLLLVVIDAPNIITPNGDGVNDQWNITGLEAFGDSPSTLRIFDRYGKEIYTSTSVTSFLWDGKYLEKPLHSGTYWYIISLPDGREYRDFIVVKDRNSDF